MKKVTILIVLLSFLNPIFAQSTDNLSYEKQFVTEICGVKFGSTFESAKKFLENKFGSSEKNIGNPNLSLNFKNQFYGGYYFNVSSTK